MSARRLILFVHGSDEWYGSDIVLFDIIQALKGSEFDAHVVVPDDIESELSAETRLSGRLRSIGVPVTTTALAVMRRRYMTPAGVVSVARRARSSVESVLQSVDRQEIALVHSHTATVLTGALIAARLGVPHVWHVSEIVERPRLVRYLLAKAIARSADRVVAVSEAVSEHLSATAPAIGRKCDVIFNSLDPTRFLANTACSSRARLGLSDGPVVGMIGRVGTMKGQEILLRAAPSVLRDHPTTTFLLVGGVLHNRTTDLDRLTALARRLGVEQHVRIMGFDSDVPGILQAMDVVVQPSVRPESFGMTVLEAMAAAKPVVAAAHGGVLEIVRDGETGLLVVPGDPDGLARAISTLLASTALRERMGAAGRERVLSHFSTTSFRDGYLRTYRQVLDRNPLATPAGSTVRDSTLRRT